MFLHCMNEFIPYVCNINSFQYGMDIGWGDRSMMMWVSFSLLQNSLFSYFQYGCPIIKIIHPLSFEKCVTYKLQLLSENGENGENICPCQSYHRWSIAWLFHFLLLFTHSKVSFRFLFTYTTNIMSIFSAKPWVRREKTFQWVWKSITW